MSVTRVVGTPHKGPQKYDGQSGSFPGKLGAMWTQAAVGNCSITGRFPCRHLQSSVPSTLLSNISIKLPGEPVSNNLKFPLRGDITDLLILQHKQLQHHQNKEE